MEVFLRFAETVFGLLACLSVGIIVAVAALVGNYLLNWKKQEKLPPIRQEVEADFENKTGNGLATGKKDLSMYLGIFRHLEVEPKSEYFWLKRQEWELIPKDRRIWRNPFSSNYYYRRITKDPPTLEKSVVGKTAKQGWEIRLDLKIDYSIIPEPTASNLQELQKVIENLGHEPIRDRFENRIEGELLKLIRSFPETDLLSKPETDGGLNPFDEKIIAEIYNAARSLGLTVVQEPTVDITKDGQLIRVIQRGAIEGQIAKDELEREIWKIRKKLMEALPGMLQEDRAALRKLLVDKMTELMVASIKYDRADAGMIAQQVVGQAWQGIGNNPLSPSIINFLSTGNLSTTNEKTGGNFTAFSQDSVKKLLEGPLAAKAIRDEQGQVMGVMMTGGVTVRVDRGLNNIEITYPNTRPYPFPLPSSEVPWPEDIPRNWALLLYGMGVVAGIREASRRSK